MRQVFGEEDKYGVQSVWPPGSLLRLPAPKILDKPDGTTRMENNVCCPVCEKLVVEVILTYMMGFPEVI